MIEGEKLIPINIEDEMKSSYIDYSMSVIISRALPDVRDGLKPVHRRVLYGMYELGILSNRPYKKSARIVGEVLGKFHPHGDNTVYDTIVRMAQGWSLRYKLIDGQGNFGSLDNDPPAAMRYTEVRLEKISEEMLLDIEKDTVNMQLNFDDTLEEPTVLPTRIPNLLINGVSGIAVGMATNMAPHNLKESIDAICTYIEDRTIDIDSLMQYIKAPDFPTGGVIYGYQGVRDAFHTGRGRIVLRAKIHFEEVRGRECIIVDEIPYQVNKENMVNDAKRLIEDKKLEGLYDVKDESGRQGMRVVYFLKNDAVPNVVLNKLYKYTTLQTYFNVNNIALVKGRPVQMNLKDLIRHFVDHRHEVIVRRTQYELGKAEKRDHILKGLFIALDHLDAVIRLIRSSVNSDEAHEGLINAFNLSEVQARAILDMRLQRLTGLERKKIKEEYEEIQKTIAYLNDVLSQEPLRMQVIKDELLEVKDKYSDKRRTEINYSGGEVTIEDLIADEQVVLTISHAGYIKRTPLSEYKRQARGGVGNRGATTRDEDFLEHLLVATNHQYMLFFTERGKCFWMRVFEISEGSKLSKGRAIQNLINIEQGDKVRAYILTGDLSDTEYINSHYVVMITEQGIIKRTLLEQYSRPRRDGINATIIRKGDALLAAKLTRGNSDILIAVKSGKAIRFPEEKVRSMGRMATGVRSITLADAKDTVIGMICIDKDEKEREDVLVVSEKGFGKRSNLENYRVTNRGGKGVKTINITKKTSGLIAINNVSDQNDLMIIKKSGVLIRMSISELRVMGRATQGVKLINLKDNDRIAAVAKVPHEQRLQEVTERLTAESLQSSESSAGPPIELDKISVNGGPVPDNPPLV
ncbi:MAG: DNA gyrase subunit A [Flavobacteriales bacterium]